MTTEPKMLTEADIRAGLPRLSENDLSNVLALFRERGLIAEEPVDPLLVEAREIAAAHSPNNQNVVLTAYRNGDFDDTPDVQSILAALRRGMELAPRKELTREMVLKAHWHATGAETVEANLIDRLHAALTEALQ